MLRRATTVAVGLVALAGLAAVGGGSAAAAPTAPPWARYDVDLNQLGNRLPERFVGLSYEANALRQSVLDPDRGNFDQLLRTLGRGSLRYGGLRLEDTYWSPTPVNPDDQGRDGRWYVDAAMVNRLGRMAGAADWNVLYGINLAAYDKAGATAQAREVVAQLGPRLARIACGNEPDGYVGQKKRPAGYTVEKYLPEVKACQDDIQRATSWDTPLSGPGTMTGEWLRAYAKANQNRRNLELTRHYYGLNTCDYPNATADTLLSPATTARAVKAVREAVTVAKAFGRQFRLDEIGSVHGGLRCSVPAGLANSYATALWGVNNGLAMAQNGLSGMNLHGSLDGNCGGYSPLCGRTAAERARGQMSALPLYYGLMMLNKVGPGQFLGVRVSYQNPDAAVPRVYALKGTDGRLRVVAVHPGDLAGKLGPVNATIRVGGTNGGTVTVNRLTGDALNTDQNVLVDGAAVAADGTHGGRPAKLTYDGAEFAYQLRPGTAVVFTVDKK